MNTKTKNLIIIVLLLAAAQTPARTKLVALPERAETVIRLGRAAVAATWRRGLSDGLTPVDVVDFRRRAFPSGPSQ